MAKRLAIGSKVGKFNQTSKRFCGLSTEQYMTDRDTLISILKEMPIDLNETDQGESVYLL